MIEIQTIRSIYFLGIGGIGMSAIARYFLSRGVAVYGYDKAETALTVELEQEGAVIHYVDDVQAIPTGIDVVVYTPAIPKDHTELQYFINSGFPVLKRSDILGLITNNGYSICVAGTHGKTTVTTMIAHILRDSGYGCNAFLGGISGNYDVNFWSHNNNVYVVEADEYDRSFLKLEPSMAVITSMDADHLDIYRNADAVTEAFVLFSKKIKQGGWLVKKAGMEKEACLTAEHVYTYGAFEASKVFAKNIKKIKGGYLFDVQIENESVTDFSLFMGGLHNIENATAAIAITTALGIDKEKIRNAVRCFKGVKRRFQVIANNAEVIYIDDYAHHPQELKALLTGVRDMYEGCTCTIIFQPHLYSRTRDHAQAFADVLSMADDIILLPIYPAREQPIEGVDSYMVAAKMAVKNVKILSKEDAVTYVHTLLKNKNQVLITAGAGDIDSLVTPIKNLIEDTIGQ